MHDSNELPSAIDINLTHFLANYIDIDLDVRLIPKLTPAGKLQQYKSSFSVKPTCPPDIIMFKLQLVLRLLQWYQKNMQDQ